MRNTEGKEGILIMLVTSCSSSPLSCKEKSIENKNDCGKEKKSKKRETENKILDRHLLAVGIRSHKNEESIRNEY